MAPPYISLLIRDISFKDDVTVILLLGVSFMISTYTLVHPLTVFHSNDNHLSSSLLVHGYTYCLVVLYMSYL